MKKHFYPEWYHGEHKKKSFFEGWYFKHVIDQQAINFALIPGISNDPLDAHAFIQLIVTPMMITKYFRFDITSFSTTQNPFSVKIDQHRFSLEGIHVNLIDDDFSFYANLTYTHRTPLQTSYMIPNIMGPFSYLPNMECNHGVLSMSHYVNGTIKINQQTYDLNQEKGYIEKDWGVSFPKKYVWLQCNHFNDSTTSFMGSIAVIPYLGFTFEGHIFNLIHQGKEYRFATYNGSKFKLDYVNPKTRVIELRKGRYRCVVKAYIEKTGSLKSPRHGLMQEMIKEGLEGTIQIMLYDKDTCVLDLIGNNAGVEFTGY